MGCSFEAHDAACAGSPYGDRWPSWKAELFDPAARLLKAAPWVFARGNHEDCKRGGKGWFRLLDADPRARTCPAHSDTFLVDIGGISLGVLDSADPDDSKIHPAEADAYPWTRLSASTAPLASRKSSCVRGSLGSSNLPRYMPSSRFSRGTTT